MAPGSSEISGSGQARGDNIIRDAENEAEMRAKRLAQEKRERTRVLQKYGLSEDEYVSQEQLIQAAGSSLTALEDRRQVEHKPLKDRRVIVNPQTESVQAERARIEAETAEVSRKVLENLPPDIKGSLTQKNVLKGRITEKLHGS